MLEKSISWFTARKGKVTYSMTDRRGPKSYDCSSAVYYALIEAGVFPSTIFIGNTDSLYRDLERHGFTLVQGKNGVFSAQRGDIFLWGVRGQSGGAAGHTGQFVNPDDIIHCNYGYNGITVNNHDLIAKYNGWPELTIYRHTGSTTPQPTGSATDQIVEPGSFIKFEGSYTAHDVQFQANTWQIRTNDLCKADFTWEDNGIPAGLVTEVDAHGFATADQELAIGSLYKIPGKFLVLDVGESNGHWLAQVGFGAMTFWVDIETATEVTGNDAGTPLPTPRQEQPVVTPTVPTPVPPPQTPAPVEAPKPVEETPKPSPVELPAPQPVGNAGYTEADRARDAATHSVVQEIWKLLKSIWGSLTSLHKKVKK